MQLAPGFVELEDRARERDERGRLGRLLAADVDLPQLVRELVLQQQVVDLAVLAQAVEVEVAELVEPLLGELAQSARRAGARPTAEAIAAGCPGR